MSGRHRGRGGERGSASPRGRGSRQQGRRSYDVAPRGRGRGGHVSATPRYQGRHAHERTQSYPPPPGRWTTMDIRDIAGSGPEEAVLRVTNEQTAFLNAFEFYPSLEKPQVIKNLVKILYHLISTPVEADRGFASRMLSLILSGEGKFASFCMKLKILVQKDMFEPNPRRDDRCSTLFYLIQVGKFCAESIPQSVIYTFPLSELKTTVDELCQEVSGQEFTSLKTPLRELVEMFTEKRKEFKRIKQIQDQQVENQVGSSTINLDDQDPPDNFREIQILPMCEEIQNPGKKPFLRTNLVGKQYKSWEHYLDVQFRLLREDFVAPLRKGIECFVQSGERSGDVLVYEGVHVLAPVCLYSGIGFQIQFDVERSHLSRVRWEHSRRLIFGSLLCLSQDNFQNVLFATIVNRDVELLAQGKVTVKFEGDVSGFHIQPTEEFLMVESTAYLEAYRHVLERLQNINGDQMPFKPYIVGGFNCQEVPLPRYCCQHGRLTLDLNHVLELKRGRRQFDVNELASWPHHDETCLDESQINALQMALTQEVSVIQGPPGTGKTYIGLKIVEALLQNRRTWDPHRNSPILVVCYTNHALDQFLEGIQGSGIKNNNPKIVRVGGRCKSENIKDCALANVVRKIKEEKRVPTKVFRERKELQLTIKEQKEIMDELFVAEDVLKGKVLSLEVLANSMPPDHYQQLMALGLHGRDWGKEVEVWLNLWFAASSEEADLQDLNEDEQLAAAIATSLQVNEPREEEQPAAQPLENEERQLINIEDEPQLLEQDRLDEGELELIVAEGHHPQNPAKIFDRATPQAPAKDSDSGWQVKQIDDGKRKKRIKEGMKCLPMKPHKARAVNDIWKLSNKERWQLYHYWFNTYIQQKKEEVMMSADRYQYACDARNTVDKAVNILALQEADVVGMTTTGAAKHSYILREGIHPKIVIIEEAAEVFESHVVTSLCPSVEQLILIGDHKQLRPKPNCYEIGKKFLLDISLFERLARSGFPIATLAYQHRMRPEIASIVATHVYDKLKNAPSVHSHPSVCGVGKNLFFIDHNFLERANPTADQRSHANLFEARFLVAFCRYLLQQDYHPTQITILTMYRGQLIELKHMMRKEEFGGVRVAAVDDFQGEENDIILLSLVRSNSDGKIGFLKIENRICVALSRARWGMYVIGNLSMLRDKDDTKWPAILIDLEKHKFLGTGIPLCCQNHPDNVIRAETPEDFSKRPEGGCGKVCGFRLPCGHACRSPCHPKDKEHKLLYKCHQVCQKGLPCGHLCQSKCFNCIDGHSPCSVRVAKVIPKCQHIIEMRCGTSPDTFPCSRPCNKFLHCGHQCQERCSVPCTKKCMVYLNVTLSCGHTMSDVPCFLSHTDIKCSHPCRALLECGHECAGTCGTCHKGRLHVQCQSRCDRILPCGHICTFPCTANCPPCTKPCNNYCSHSKCPKLCYEPCTPCMEPCEWRCNHQQCRAPCGSMCERPVCDYPCQKRLKCSHQCVGVCGEKCICGICNNEEVHKIFFGTEDEPEAMFIQLKDCLHIFEVSGLDYWMGMKEESEEGSHAIQMKGCPQCKTPIRRSLRYGNIVKTRAKEVEEVKTRMLDGKDGSQPKINEMIMELKRVDMKAASQSAAIVHVKPLIAKMYATLQPPEKWKKGDATWLFPHHIDTFQNQLLLIPNLLKLFQSIQSLSSSPCKFNSITIQPADIKRDANSLVMFLTMKYLTDQQLNDAHCELRRLFCLERVCKVNQGIAKCKETLKVKDSEALADTAIKLFEGGHTKPKITKEEQKEIDMLLGKIGSCYGVGKLTESERMEIVKAIGLSKGHWFKCPNGHIYCIGECGGATVEAKCPECKATIGGTHHRLRSDNTHAPEMDGSSHPAWSDAANMANYDLRHLQNF